MRIGRRGLLTLSISLIMAGTGWLAGGSPGTAFALVGHSYYVATTGSDATSCQANSNLHPFQTVTRAMTCVAADPTTVFGPDLVHIAAGTYPENVIITGNVNLLGAGEAATIISPYGGTVIFNDGYTVGISGMTLRDGNADGSGGGIDNFDHGAMTVTNSLVTGNMATSCGGGIYNEGSMKLVNTPVTLNSADAGGGIFNAFPGTVTLNNSPVMGNAAYIGGGIFNGPCGNTGSGGTVTLTNSRVSDNDAFSYGGGIFNVSLGSVTLINSPVGGSHLPAAPSASTHLKTNGSSQPLDPTAGNTAEQGGGIANDGVRGLPGTVTLLNSPVSFNGGCYGGGGAWNVDGGVLRLQNSAVTGNVAATFVCAGTKTNIDAGGGIETDGSPLTLKNEDIFQNYAEDDGGGLYDSAGPDDSCTGLPGVTMSNTTITRNLIDNC